MLAIAKHCKAVVRSPILATLFKTCNTNHSCCAVKLDMSTIGLYLTLFLCSDLTFSLISVTHVAKQVVRHMLDVATGFTTLRKVEDLFAIFHYIASCRGGYTHSLFCSLFHNVALQDARTTVSCDKTSSVYHSSSIPHTNHSRR